jgi:PAS domain S-box-containing protein
VLIALLLVFLWLAHSIILPQARERDLNRIKLYTGLAKHLLEADAVAGVGTEQTLEKIRKLGLTNPEILSLENIPVRKSPRYIAPHSQVEAWEIFRGSDGQAAGVVRITRWDDTTRWALGILRMAAVILAIGGLLVIATTILITYLPLILRLQRLATLTRSKFGLPPADHRRVAQSPLHDLKLALETAADKVLREDEQRQRLLENHAEAACLGTIDGRLLEVNHAYCRLFGKTREQLVGTNYLDLIPPADRTEVVDSLRKLSPRHPANTMTHRVLSPTGKVLWLRWRDSAIFNDAGKVKEVASFGLDVTAEHELAAQNERLQLAFTQMQSLARTGCLAWDLTRDQMDWTDETWRLFGLDKHASQPSMDQLLAVVTPVDRGPLRELFRRARENGDPFEYEFRCSLPDGSSRTVQSRVEVRADPKTKLLDQLTCTFHDITALRDAESSTKRELRFRQAIEQSLGTGIVVIDESGKCLLVNPAFCEMTGWPAEELIAQLAPYCYWPEEERPAIREAFERTLRGEAAPDGMELRFCRKNGTRFDVLIKVAPLLDNEDRPLGWLGAVTDITSIQHIRRDLLATNERLCIAQDVAEFGIWDWDPVKNILHWDRKSFALFGHPEATDAQTVWCQVHSEAEQERLTGELNRLIAAGGSRGRDLIRARWPDGTRHDIASTYVILRDQSGRATRVLGLNYKVTAEPGKEHDWRSRFGRGQ